MNEQIVKAQDIFLDKINRICGKFGLNNIMAQLYAILYLSDKPLSLNDMVERLKISKGSASVNIRALERYGTVRRVWVKGSRKDYYEAEPDIEKVVLDRIRSMAQRRLAEVSDMISSSSTALNSIKSDDKTDEASVTVFNERLRKLKALYDNAQSLFDLFNLSVLKQSTSNEAGNAKKDVSYISGVAVVSEKI